MVFNREAQIDYKQINFINVRYGLTKKKKNQRKVW